ncbi:MAG: Gfo/Idh/MocA family protein, partial [Armatimonadota bacterium]
LLADERVDVISICTPIHLHARETIAAAQAGKHILIEKPVALNLADLKAMRDAVRNAGVKTVVSFVLRWNPSILNAKALIERGVIGDVFYAECDYWHGTGDWWSGYEWAITREMGGSSFLLGGCHAVDAIRYLIGADVIEVTAYETKGVSTLKYEFPATTVGIVKYANGAIGKICSSVECQMPYQFNVDIMGSTGTIRDNLVWSTTHLPGQKHFAEIPTILPDSGDVTHHPFQDEIDHFVACILNDVESHVNLEDAVNTHEACIAMDISAAEGRAVRLPLIRD